MRRLVMAAGSAAVVAAAATIPVTGQAGGPPLVITACNGGAPIPYSVPKTP